MIIKQVRKEKGLTQKALAIKVSNFLKARAKKSGLDQDKYSCTQQTISQIENGEIAGSINTIFALSTILNIPYSKIVLEVSELTENRILRRK